MRTLSWIGLAQRTAMAVARSAGLARVIQRSLLDYQASVIHVCLDVVPPGSEAIRVLHLSDLHLDGIPDGCDRLCAALSTLPCDVCVITGDFVDPDVGDRFTVETRLARMLSAVK